MTRIQELFEEAVAAPPPSRLTAEGVLGASRVRRQRRYAITTTLVAAGLAVAAVAVVLSANGRGVAPANPLESGTLVWAGRGDANHLYVIKDLCGVNQYLDRYGERRPEGVTWDQPCRELLASVDGGQTWLSRGVMSASELQIVDPVTLIRIIPPGTAPTPTTGTRSGDPLEFSTDAGATWTVMPADGPRINAVPAGGDFLGHNSTPRVFDPYQGRLRPLNRPPDLLEPWYVSRTDSAIWFVGFDPASRRPAIAVSHDGGATWIERVLPNTEAAFEDVTVTDGPNAGTVVRNLSGGTPGPILSRDGVTAYAFLPSLRPTSTPAPSLPPTDDDLWSRLYQTVDGGVTWQEQAGAGAPASRGQWLTDDGRIVLYFDRRLDGTAGASFAVSPDGRTYTMTPLPGLPESVLNVAGKAAFGAHAMYTTDDGWTWRQVWSG